MKDIRSSVRYITFKETLFPKKPEVLEKWMEDAERLKIGKIDSFVNGRKFGNGTGVQRVL